MVSSFPRVGLYSFSKPTFKIKRREDFCFDEIPSFAGSHNRYLSLQYLLWIFQSFCNQIVLKTSFPSLTEEHKMGCERFKTKNVHKSKDRTRMRMQNQSGIKSYGTSTGRYTLHGKKKQEWKTKTQMKVPRRWVLMGQDLTICGGCQGYMDFFSEVFCVVSFFFSSTLHFCTPRNSKMENIIKDWKKGQTLSVTFPNADSVKVLVFVFFFFYKQLSLILTVGKATAQVL